MYSLLVGHHTCILLYNQCHHMQKSYILSNIINQVDKFIYHQVFQGDMSSIILVNLLIA